MLQCGWTSDSPPMRLPPRGGGEPSAGTPWDPRWPGHTGGWSSTQRQACSGDAAVRSVLSLDCLRGDLCEQHQVPVPSLTSRSAMLTSSGTRGPEDGHSPRPRGCHGCAPWQGRERLRVCGAACGRAGACGQGGCRVAGRSLALGPVLQTRPAAEEGDGRWDQEQCSRLRTLTRGTRTPELGGACSPRAGRDRPLRE